MGGDGFLLSANLVPLQSLEETQDDQQTYSFLPDDDYDSLIVE